MCHKIARTERGIKKSSHLVFFHERQRWRMMRSVRDEHYVLDLCDELLGRSAARQHPFPWLRGDSGRPLPVDAFYADLGLVIEYRENQHDQPGPRHWNKPTISGVPRDDQRRHHDQLRDVEIPAHGGLQLLIITPAQLDATTRDLADVRRALGDILPPSPPSSQRQRPQPGPEKPS